MQFSRKTIGTAALLLGSLPALAAAPQYYGQQNYYGQQGYNRGYYQRGGGGFDQGLRNGGRGGDYYDQRHEYDGYNQRNDAYYHYGDRRYREQHGGIGPGKGALIGGAGGAVLGGLLGGGLKGSIIGGAAGAGIGAALGEANQNRRRNEDYYGR